MGCICIPSTVAGLAGPMPSEAWMSGNYRRTVQGCAPHSCRSTRTAQLVRVVERVLRMVLLGGATRAASNWLCQPELAPEFSSDSAPPVVRGGSVVLL